jgi:hypothetical protein
MQPAPMTASSIELAESGPSHPHQETRSSKHFILVDDALLVPFIYSRLTNSLPSRTVHSKIIHCRLLFNEYPHERRDETADKLIIRDFRNGKQDRKEYRLQVCPAEIAYHRGIQASSRNFRSRALA